MFRWRFPPIPDSGRGVAVFAIDAHAIQCRRLRPDFGKESPEKMTGHADPAPPVLSFPKTLPLRTVLLPFGGPMCHMTLVVPTRTTNDKGLPHTLEHLIFCGSKHIPNRGYLDLLAARSLSTGTNAYVGTVVRISLETDRALFH